MNVTRIRKDIPIITELVHPSNISFLISTQQDYKLMKKYGVYHTEIYAMGETYISSVMDTLIAQAFYNSALISVLDQVIVGNSSTGGELEENCNLFPLRVPSTFIGRTFAELFNFLCERKHIIALGLYRYNEQVTTKPYIVTNPPEDLVLTDRDMVFVLAKTMINYDSSNKWGSPLEDDDKDERSFVASNNLFKKPLNNKQEVEQGPGGEFEVNDYLDKINVENKRRKELKDNADIVKKLKKRCDDISRRIESLGDKIKNRPQDLAAAISDVLKKNPSRDLKKTPGRSFVVPKDQNKDEEDYDSDSS